MQTEKFLSDSGLPDLDSNEIDYAFEEITKELLISREKIMEIIIALQSGRHVILSGPIGTGKTELAQAIPKTLWQKVGGYHTEVYTATSEWGTQEVIGGIIPIIDGDKIIYEYHYGCALETVLKNWELGIYGGYRY